MEISDQENLKRALGMKEEPDDTRNGFSVHLEILFEARGIYMRSTTMVLLISNVFFQLSAPVETTP
jgi:hypothetical protein